ncbi:MAG: tetratricopeptide repeat protein [Rhizonema sp. PD38]|nr:tetratricopeptide repeat protein [Rhizonema sp. PD38]
MSDRSTQGILEELPMFYRLKCFTLATLVIALTFTVSAASTTPSPQANQAQTTQQRAEEVLRLVKLGFEQFHKSQFREALETFQQALVIVRELGDRKGEEGTLYTIGQIYYNLEQYSKALDFYYSKERTKVYLQRSHLRPQQAITVCLPRRKLSIYPLTLSSLS